MGKDKKRFEELYRESMKLYRVGKLEECLNLVEQLDKETTLNKELLLLDRAQLLAGLRRFEEAYKLLEEFIVERSLWIDDRIINFKEFRTIRDNKRFLKLIEESKKNQLSSFNGKHETFSFVNKYVEGNKVIFLLHRNRFFTKEEHMYKAVPRFRKEMESLPNVTLCLLYSSKVGILGYPYWYDYFNGSQEVALSIEQIIKRNNIKREDVIIVGFSAGAGVLFEGTINRKLNFKNIVLMKPHLPLLTEREGKIGNLSNKYNFYIQTAVKDKSYEQSLALDKLLTQNEIEHSLLIEEGRGQTIPKGMTILFNKFIHYFN